MGFFIAVGLFGLLFFIGSALFGHHDFGHGDHDLSHESDHGTDHESGPSAFSTFCIAWTVMGFGSVGAFMRYYEFGMPISTLGGAGGGALLWLVSFKAMSLLHRQQGDSLVTSDMLANAQGVLTMGINGRGDYGKMRANLAGSQELIVTAEYAIPSGTTVRVINTSGGIYHVEPTVP